MPSTPALPDAPSPVPSALLIWETLAELGASPSSWRALAARLTDEADLLERCGCLAGPVQCRRDRATDCLARARTIELTRTLAARAQAERDGDFATVRSIDKQLGRTVVS